jgi:hypothetical protein
MPLTDNIEISRILRRLRGYCGTKDDHTELQRRLIELIKPRMNGRQYAIIVHRNPEGHIILGLTILGEESPANRVAVDLPAEFMHSMDIIQVVAPPSYDVVQVIKDRFDWCTVGGTPWPDRTTWKRALPVEDFVRKTAWQHLLENDE